MNDPDDGPFLIAGLGNAGREYRANRHNVGFQLADRLATELDTGFTKVQANALVASGRYHGHRILLAKPQLLMNRSGRPVASLIRYYRVPRRKVLIAYDDLDLPLGVIRLRPNGGSGGHRGLSDILLQLGHEDLPRLRIGIGRPPGRMEPADYVLMDFAEDERLQLEQTLDRAAQCALMFIRSGIDLAMNECNERQPD